LQQPPTLLLEGSDVALVRVSHQLVDELLAHDSEPVILVGPTRQEDGTYDMTFKTPVPLVERTPVDCLLSTLSEVTDPAAPFLPPDREGAIEHVRRAVGDYKNERGD
jgi:hypothetical protein